MHKLPTCLIAALLLLGAGCGGAAAPQTQLSSSVSAAPPAISAPAPAPVKPTAVMPEDIFIEVNGICVKVDPMIELLTIAQYLSGYGEQFPGLLTKLDSAYKKEMSATFDGKSMAGYTIVLSPMMHGGGYGPTIEKADGTHIYSVNGPIKMVGEQLFFGNETSINNLVLHEFGHSFIPIADFDNAAMQETAGQCQHLMEPIRADMEQQAYAQWSAAYEEHVLRAAVIDIVLKNVGTLPAGRLSYERKVGFAYIDDIYQCIQGYSQNRSAYPTIDAFIPVITDYLLEQYPK